MVKLLLYLAERKKLLDRKCFEALLINVNANCDFSLSSQNFSWKRKLQYENTYKIKYKVHKKTSHSRSNITQFQFQTLLIDFSLQNDFSKISYNACPFLQFKNAYCFCSHPWISCSISFQKYCPSPRQYIQIKTSFVTFFPQSFRLCYFVQCTQSSPSFIADHFVPPPRKFPFMKLQLVSFTAFLAFATGRSLF